MFWQEERLGNTHKGKFHHYVKACPREISKGKRAGDIGRWLAQNVQESTTFVTAPHGSLCCFTSCATDVDQAQDMVDRVFKALVRNNMDQSGFD